MAEVVQIRTGQSLENALEEIYAGDESLRLGCGRCPDEQGVSASENAGRDGSSDGTAGPNLSEGRVPPCTALRRLRGGDLTGSSASLSAAWGGSTSTIDYQLAMLI